MERKRILVCSGIATGVLTMFKYYISVKAQSFILSIEITAFSQSMVRSCCTLLLLR